MTADLAVAFSGPGSNELTWRNWANLVAFALNTFVTWTAQLGIYGPTNTVLSKKYQLIVTPAGFAFSIWGAIFMWQGVFTAAQMTSRFRGSKIVQLVTPGWVAACSFQVGWNLSFAQEMMPLQLVCMLGILAGLLHVVLSTDGLEMTPVEFATLRGCFSLHLGWIVAASSLSINVVADAAKSSPDVMLGLAITCCGAICVMAAIFALAMKTADPIACLVVAWAFNAIRAELSDPTDLDDPTRYNPHMWDRDTLGGFQIAARNIAFLALGLAAVAIARVVLAAPVISNSKQSSAGDVQIVEA